MAGVPILINIVVQVDGNPACTNALTRLLRIVRTTAPPG